MDSGAEIEFTVSVRPSNKKSDKVESPSSNESGRGGKRSRPKVGHWLELDSFQERSRKWLIDHLYRKSV